MRWSSSLSRDSDASTALSRGVEAVRSQLGDAPADLVLLFWSEHHSAQLEGLAAGLEHEFPSALRIGCSAASVIGAGQEIEGEPGLALAAAHLPGVTLSAFHAESVSVARSPDPVSRWREIVGVAPEHEPHFIVLCDPFSTDGELLARGLDEAFPGGVKIGGLASGGDEPGTIRLLLEGRIHETGVVGIALCGNVEIDTVVAQGCRPVGQPMFVTRSSGNVLLELDGRPPVEMVSELYARASPRDQELFRSSLFLGVQMRASETEYAQGDFLIRNLIGGDPEAGSLTAAAHLADNQVVQFHLRDADTASEDLERQLARAPIDSSSARGALLFSCLGRGASLFGVENHDSEMFQRHLGPIPLAGFFCNGEIGPVQRQTFLHGYTSAFGVFRPRTGQA